MKKIFLFLVAIVFVLVGYGLSEARKYKVVCTYTVESLGVYANFLSIRGARAENLGKEGAQGKFPIFVRIKKKDGSFKEYIHNNAFIIKDKRIRIDGSYGGYVRLGQKKEIGKFKKMFGENPSIKCYAESVDVDILGNASSTSVTVSSSNKTPVSSGSGNKLLQSIKEQLDRLEKKLKLIEKKLAFIGIK